ncbi:MAG: oligosaccharide flippase family protein [bacterium]|nr:oligosaccharide flippase family protein [bacterium]
MNIKEEKAQNPQNIKGKIVNHVAKFSFASFIGGLGGFFSSYFGALLLGPTIWGTWQGAMLVLQYGSSLHLGVPNGMDRELPLMRGKKELGRQAVITDVTFTFSFIVALIVSSGILVSTFVLTMQPELKLSLQFIAAMIFFQYISAFYGSFFRAHNEFGTVSKVAIIGGLGNFFSIALIFFFGFRGFLGGQLIRFFVITCYSYFKSSYSIKWRWDNQCLNSLIMIGFPIMLMLFANLLFTTVDRILILKFLDTKSLGFYSLGNLVFAPLLMIFTASNSVMYPRFTEKYGETGTTNSLIKYITVPIKNLAVLMPILIGVIYIALPFLVKVFLPAYIEGIAAARILIMGLFFYGIAGMAGNMFLTVNRQVMYLVITIGSALLNLCFSYIGAKLGYGIIGVAIGASLAYFIFSITSVILAMRFAKASLKETNKLLMGVLGHIFYVCVIITIFSIWMPIFPSKMSSMINVTVLQELIFLSLNAYFIYKILHSEIGTLFIRRNSI